MEFQDTKTVWSINLHSPLRKHFNIPKGIEHKTFQSPFKICEVDGIPTYVSSFVKHESYLTTTFWNTTKGYFDSGFYPLFLKETYFRVNLKKIPFLANLFPNFFTDVKPLIRIFLALIFSCSSKRRIFSSMSLLVCLK